MSDSRPVVVLQLPENLIQGTARSFFQEIVSLLRADRPRVVFDFSQVSKLDSSGVEFLLNSMEEVLKRNGDLKLAALPPAPAIVLELTKVDRLFEVFDRATDAVESFHRFPLHAFAVPPKGCEGVTSVPSSM